MTFSVRKIILHNRAPFEHLEIDFNIKGLSMLNAVNGGGKTTVLSYIADAWYEFVRLAFPGEYEGRENKYYRLSSPIYSLDQDIASIVYIRFTNGDKSIDYVDARTPCTQAEYDAIIQLKDKIEYTTIKSALDGAKNVKYISETNFEGLRKIFNANVITYFPAYRHEQPGYLNDPFKIKLNYNLSSHFEGYLKNPVEIVSSLPDLANWLLDIVLDRVNFQDHVTSKLFDNINLIFTKSLGLKSGENVFLGVGRRNSNATRIQIGKRQGGLPSGEWLAPVYPSIFNMSSGENAIICLFVEILRQFDNIMPLQSLDQAEGVVLIDEIDKHLHIRLQTEILPNLFALFPNVQFIISSHSPFVSMGLVSTKARLEIVDLDRKSITSDATSTLVFKEAYDEMIDENERFQNLYNELMAKNQSTKLQIVSEGKNFEHIKRAIELLEPSLLSKVDFPYSDKTGKDQLKNAYEVLLSAKHTAKFLFVWDCDCLMSHDSLSETDSVLKFVFAKNSSNTKVTKGIENLYPEGLFTDEMYSIKETTDGYGAKKSIQEFDRNKFIAKVQQDNDSANFYNFRLLINKIRDILAKNCAG